MQQWRKERGNVYVYCILVASACVCCNEFNTNPIRNKWECQLEWQIVGNLEHVSDFKKIVYPFGSPPLASPP